MHTVKSRESIKESYFKYGVKAYSLDSKDELIKILKVQIMQKILNYLLEFQFQMSMLKLIYLKNLELSNQKQWVC